MVQLQNFLRIWEPMPNLFSLLQGKRCCHALFTTVLVCLDHDSLLVMWTPRNMKLSTSSTSAPSMLMGACSALLFLQSMISSFVFLTLRESLFPLLNILQLSTYFIVLCTLCCILPPLFCTLCCVQMTTLILISFYLVYHNPVHSVVTLKIWSHFESSLETCISTTSDVMFSNAIKKRNASFQEELMMSGCSFAAVSWILSP